MHFIEATNVIKELLTQANVYGFGHANKPSSYRLFNICPWGNLFAVTELKHFSLSKPNQEKIFVYSDCMLYFEAIFIDVG